MLITTLWYAHMMTCWLSAPKCWHPEMRELFHLIAIQHVVKYQHHLGDVKGWLVAAIVGGIQVMFAIPVAIILGLTSWRYDTEMYQELLLTGLKGVVNSG